MKKFILLTAILLSGCKTDTTDLKLEPVIVDATPKIVLDYTEVECLAKNIYFEARGESIFGQIAVAQVTLNRTKDHRFPDNVCGVIYQAKLSTWWKETHNRNVPVRNMCQFSWYCDGKSDNPKDLKSWKQALHVADTSLRGEYIDVTEGALWYHSKKVNPEWSSHFTKTTVIDNHYFYR